MQKEVDSSPAKKDIYKASEHHAHIYYQNMFWAMVAGIIPFERSQLVCLAREIHTALKMVPGRKLKAWEIEHYQVELSKAVYDSSISSCAHNPAHPHIFLDHDTITIYECLLVGEIRTLLGLNVCRKSYISIEVYSNFFAFVTRLNTGGIGTVYRAVPPLHSLHNQQRLNEQHLSGA